MKRQLHKLFTAITIGVLVLNSISLPLRVYAEDAPVAPTAPSAPTAPVAPTAPEAPTSVPTAPSAPTAPVAPTAPTAPTPSVVSSSPTTTTTPTPTQKQPKPKDNDSSNGSTGTKEEGDPHRTESDSSATKVGVNPTPSPTPGGVGSADIKTGDATNGATIATNANNNASSQSGVGGSGTGATVANTGNGSDSTNNGSATLSNTNATNQNNTAVVNSNLTGATVTGNNNASNNVGNASINTGDANTTGTIITTANTNVDGIMVSEFNIVDDHQGDYVLDFAANCVRGCGTPGSAINSGNGSGSSNNSSLDEASNNTTFQNNDASVGNTLVLSADSGNNLASRNTGGDSNITTGDANVSANALTFANNNFAGNVIYGTVNIFGDLIGDIVFTEEEMARYGVNTSAANTGNGSGSTNNANLSQNTTDDTFQNNDASITNTLVYDAQTGNNAASGNTGGDSSIATGDTNLVANVLNIANTNVAGGNMWLVLVNQAGKWVGKLMGAPEGSMYAGSQGMEFTVGENGEVTASNGGNGSDSTNNASVSESNTNTTTQNNTASINNTLDLRANTGGNETSDNTGGDSKIKTGDATIVANIVNFVNNNVSGNGKLFVTVVNVFGNFMGDILMPGQKKETIAKNTVSDKPSQENTSTSDNTSNSTNTVESVTVTKKTTEKVTGGTITSTGSTKTLSTSKKVLAATTSEASTAQPKELIKGSHFEKEATTTKMKINLAWLVVVLPIAVLLFLMKKMSSKILLRKTV